MATTQTSNLGMWLFKGADPVKYGDFNDNTKILDNLSNSVDAGQVTATDSTTWLYKKTLNVKSGASTNIPTVELWTNITLSGVKSETAIGQLYRTSEFTAKYPTNISSGALSFTDIFNVQISYQTSSLSTSAGFAVETTSITDRLQQVKYCILTPLKETSVSGKTVSIYVKGVVNG